MNGWWCAATMIGLGMSGGCGERSGPAQPAPAPTNRPTPWASGESMHLKRALPRLRTMKLWLGPKELMVEVALSPVEIATGLMFRETMPENEGMLFVFAFSHRSAFYMKNTVLPLSVAYVDPEGMILEIHDLTPLDETPQPASSDQIQYALEVNQGWFERNQIGVGTVLRTERGSLAETFLRSRRR